MSVSLVNFVEIFAKLEKFGALNQILATLYIYTIILLHSSMVKISYVHVHIYFNSTCMYAKPIVTCKL